MNGGIFMKGSSLGYLFKTGFKNVYMNRLMSLASIGVLVACLMLIGGAVLLSLNMQVIVGAVEDENEMVAFLDMDLSDSQVKQIRAGDCGHPRGRRKLLLLLGGSLGNRKGKMGSCQRDGRSGCGRQ